MWQARAFFSGPAGVFSGPAGVFSAYIVQRSLLLRAMARDLSRYVKDIQRNVMPTMHIASSTSVLKWPFIRGSTKRGFTPTSNPIGTISSTSSFPKVKGQ